MILNELVSKSVKDEVELFFREDNPSGHRSANIAVGFRRHFLIFPQSAYLSQMEQEVWDQVQALVEEPHRVADEYRRRIDPARDCAAMPDEIIRLDRQMTTLRRGLGRLLDSYTEGVIDKAEFEPRIAGLKQRESQLQERHQAALDAAETERDLALVISRLEDFSAKVTTGLDNLDRLGMQDIIRTVVRRIEIDDSRIEVIFRVPSPDPSGPASPTKTIGSWQHCTGVGRTNHRLAQSLPQARQGLGEP